MEFNDKMVIKLELCNCDGEQIELRANNPKAKCKKCGNEWQVVELERIVESKFDEDHLETEALMQSYDGNMFR